MLQRRVGSATGEPMSLLKAEPSAPVTSLAELFAIAFAMEQEAESRYAAIGWICRPRIIGVGEAIL